MPAAADAASVCGPLVVACPSVEAASLPAWHATHSGGAALSAHLGCGTRSTPVVVRGAANDNSVVRRAWTFDGLAARCDAVALHRGDLFCRVGAQTGLIEQGDTSVKTAVEPGRYLRDLHAQEASGVEARSLLPSCSAAAAALASGESVPLDWSAVAADDRESGATTYLGHWDMFSYLGRAATAAEWAPLAKCLWPSATMHWDFAWCGPGGTLTGLHYDMPNNWFVQLRGAKEFVLFGPDQQQMLPITAKYDPGARLARVDVTRLDAPAGSGGTHNDDDDGVVAGFRAARGFYVRLEPGDALYIPKHTNHLVHALSPSLSVSSFGHSPLELVTAGAWIEAREALHRCGLLGWGQAGCSCHGAAERRPWAGPAAVVAGATAAAAMMWARRG